MHELDKRLRALVLAASAWCFARRAPSPALKCVSPAVLPPVVLLCPLHSYRSGIACATVKRAARTHRTNDHDARQDGLTLAMTAALGL